MKLYFMKQKAIDNLKENMLTIQSNYFKFNTNEWIYERFEYDPFEFFMEIPDFELAILDDRSLGEIELENCKILYEHLKKISPSQASDERLWAGLCNGEFYQYVRERWKYSTLKQGNPKTDASTIKSRFFFSGGGRGAIFRNTLAKCWWAGQYTYDSANEKHWAILDAIGPEDFSTKVSDIFYSYSFTANSDVMRGVAKGLEFYRKQGIKILVREHIRPTMQYLNALGGSVLLDMYTEDEIAREVVSCIERIRNGNESAFLEDDLFQVPEDNVFEELDFQNEHLDEVNLDYREYAEEIAVDIEELNANEILGAPEEVFYGCEVYVQVGNTDKVIKTCLPKEEGEGKIYPLQQLLLGHSINEKVLFCGKRYTILKIQRIE